VIIVEISGGWATEKSSAHRGGRMEFRMSSVGEPPEGTIDTIGHCYWSLWRSRIMAEVITAA
jgi:hypothetical protein